MLPPATTSARVRPRPAGAKEEAKEFAGGKAALTLCEFLEATLLLSRPPDAQSVGSFDEIVESAVRWMELNRSPHGSRDTQAALIRAYPDTSIISLALQVRWMEQKLMPHAERLGLVDFYAALHHSAMIRGTPAGHRRNTNSHSSGNSMLMVTTRSAVCEHALNFACLCANEQLPQP